MPISPPHEPVLVLPARRGTCAPFRVRVETRLESCHLETRSVSPLVVHALALLPSWGHAAELDLPARAGTFWRQSARCPLPLRPRKPMPYALPAGALTEHALRERAESRAAWFGIQAEAARWMPPRPPTALRSPASSISPRARAVQFGSVGAHAPSLRTQPRLAYVLVDFGARAAGIDAQRYQLIASLLNNNRTLQDTVAEVEAAYFAVLAARAQEAAQAQQEAALRASLDAVEVRLRGGLAARADQLRARAALSEAQLARQTAERDHAKAMAALKRAAGIAQTQTLELDWETTLPDTLTAGTLLADLLYEAQRNRPDLQALQAAAASARAEAERARAARWPSLSLAASSGAPFSRRRADAIHHLQRRPKSVRAPFDGGGWRRRHAPPNATPNGCRPKPTASAARWR